MMATPSVMKYVEKVWLSSPKGYSSADIKPKTTPKLVEVEPFSITVEMRKNHR